MKKLIAAFICAIACCYTFSQEPTVKNDTLRKDAMNIFMDASDYIKKEIPYVNYVRDIKDARVYIILTYQNTGSGGYEETFYLVGQHEFSGMRDTLSFTSSPDDTQETIRIKEVKTLKMGLMRYVAKTPLAKFMNITFSEPLSQTVSSDKWNSWVFRGSLNAYLNGEQTYKTTYLNGSFSASRVTEKLKVNLSASYSYRKEKYDIDGDIYTFYYGSKSFNALIVKSLTDHWSYGGSLYLGGSIYNNYIASGSVMPGIEYDIYPYSQSTRRQLRLLYRAGYVYNNYIDTTIYNKSSESLLQHSFTASYQVVEKWGSIDFNMGYSNFLHNWSKNNISLDAYLDLRITKGLRLNLMTSISLVHDQINLPKGGATRDEVLLRQKVLATQYYYYASIGFSYTFGSIYNNVVNPRFGGSGGGGYYIMY